jgi:hypothetical protein
MFMDFLTGSISDKAEHDLSTKGNVKLSSLINQAIGGMVKLQFMTPLLCISSDKHVLKENVS